MSEEKLSSKEKFRASLDNPEEAVIEGTEPFKIIPEPEEGEVYQKEVSFPLSDEPEDKYEMPEPEDIEVYEQPETTEPKEKTSNIVAKQEIGKSVLDVSKAEVIELKESLVEEVEENEDEAEVNQKVLSSDVKNVTKNVRKGMSILGTGERRLGINKVRREKLKGPRINRNTARVYSDREIPGVDQTTFKQ